jgi:predicted small lipoprotein YifL
MKKLLTTLIVALVPLALAACGGDEDKGPSKADYIEKADAICARSDKETNAIFEAGITDPQDPDPDEAQAAIQEALPIVKKDLAEVKALEKPKGDEEQIDAIWAAVDTGVSNLEVAGADPDTAAAALGTEPFAESEKLADAYGMKACGSAS